MMLMWGCGNKDRSIVGTWSWQDNSTGADVAYRFASDHTYQYWFRGDRTNINENGTYEYKAGVLVLHHIRTVLTNGKEKTDKRDVRVEVNWLTDKTIEMKDPTGTTSWKRSGD